MIDSNTQIAQSLKILKEEAEYFLYQNSCDCDHPSCNRCKDGSDLRRAITTATIVLENNPEPQPFQRTKIL